MHNETIIESHTIRTQDRITTLTLTKSDKRDEWFRYIHSTDKDWNAEMGFDTLEDAQARYDRDLRTLSADKGITVKWAA